MSDKHSFDEVPQASPDFSDVANQSDQQQVAFETWVNTAISMINRGQTDTEVLATLSHDGCPDPEAVMMRAKMQPVEPEPSEEELSGMSGREDIFKPTGEEEGMEEQQAIEASVRYVPDAPRVSRVLAAGAPGTLVGEFEAYGQKMVRVALDNGGTIDVTAEHVKPADEDTTLGQIQSFIDGFPEVQHTAASIYAHKKDWDRVRLACEDYAAGAQSDYERIQFASMHSLAQSRIAELGAIELPQDVNDAALVADQVQYTTPIASEAVASMDRSNFDVDRFVTEGAAVWVSELHETTAQDAEVVATSARHHVASMMWGMDRQLVASTTERFTEAVESHRIKRVANTPSTPKTANSDLPDVPDDLLFM